MGRILNSHGIVAVILLLAISAGGFAADERAVPAGMIVGRVVDAQLGSPLEYANVVLFDIDGNEQITGSTTNADGVFRLMGVTPGIYRLEVSFMGYYPTIIDTVGVVSPDMGVRLGTVELERAVLMMEGVDVTSDKPAVEFKIDKKVINVSKHYTATSGTAVDVLENVPSVTVDVEGNVTLRGSTNFTLLIDGRPTVLEPDDALQQIPANAIENIEIITNPSAKYDPSGIAGIINIVMKKQKAQGTNGIANANIGLDDKYGADFLVNHRMEKFNVYVGANYRDETYPGSIILENQTTSGDTTSFINSSGDMSWQRKFYGLRGGIDLYLSSKDVLSFSGRYGVRDGGNTAVRNYDEWTEPGDTHDLYISETSMDRGGNYVSLNTDYTRTIGVKEHNLKGHVMLSRRSGDEESMTELFDENGLINYGVITTEKGPSQRLRANLDYAIPVLKTNMLETGYQGSVYRTTDSTEMFEYDTLTGQYEFRPEFSHTIEYDDNIHALYGIYKGEWNDFGYQAGLRGEYTYRFIELIGEDESFEIDRWDYFPTAHVSYKFPAEHEVMASYTRRINRPRGWELEPFQTWMDAYNVRVGNPNLIPEYINSYEIGYQKHFGRNFISLEGYYRETENKVERVRSVYDENIILHSVENVGTDYSFGAEAMLDWDLFKWLNVNLTGDIYDYRIEGTLYGEDFSRESFNWNTRVNATFRLTKSTRVQLNNIYYSPSVSSQGRREGFFATNAAIRQDLWNRKLSATLRLRNIFSTARHEFTSEGSDFYSYMEFSRKSPIVMFTLTFNFNRYRPDRERDENGEDFEEEQLF
ncbi:MAG: TonB-dependent receptor [candidate division WOR-3 bacterium]|nr:MAG: TonB-dependent receptor [candidate division WOR-3 bacterium]